MAFLACLCRCPQDEDYDDDKEGEQFRINRQVASGDGRYSWLNFFFLRSCFLLLFSLWYVRVRPWYSGTMLPVKLNVFLLTEGRLILRKKIRSSLLIRELDSCSVTNF